MSREILSPISTPSMLYPMVGIGKAPRPQHKHYICPRCAGNRYTRLQVEIIRKSETVYGFKCDFCHKRWYLSSKLILNEVFEEQVQKIYKFTKNTDKEFGALLVKTPEGIRLDMIDIGEDTSVTFKKTKEFRKDEEIIGSIHCILGPKTLVETETGAKPISLVVKGEKVLSQDGTYHEVQKTMKRKYTGKVIRIKTEDKKYSKRDLTLTPEHLVYIRRDGIDSWVRADELKVNDFVFEPEYLFDKCETCGKIVEYGRHSCSLSCNAKRIHKLHPELKEKNSKRLKLSNKIPDFKQKIQKGCIKRSRNPIYTENLSKGLKLAIKEGRFTPPEGFKNEETQRKAKKSLAYSSKHGSYWQRRLYEELKKIYPNKTIELEYEILGKTFPISNQFCKNCGFKHKQYFLDIAFLDEKIDIEVDGYYHNEQIQKERDLERDKFLQNNGWKVQRIPVQNIANGTFWGLLSNVLEIPNFEDPPINFIPRKIVKINEQYMKKCTVYNLEVKDDPTFVAGRILVHNCHPITDSFSDFDIATFLRDDWEKISIVVGVEGTINVMVKTKDTYVLEPEKLRDWIEENKDLSLIEKAEKFKFLLFKGKVNNLKLLAGVSNQPITSLEKLLAQIE